MKICSDSNRLLLQQLNWIKHHKRMSEHFSRKLWSLFNKQRECTLMSLSTELLKIYWKRKMWFIIKVASKSYPSPLQEKNKSGTSKTILPERESIESFILIKILHCRSFSSLTCQCTLNIFGAHLFSTRYSKIKYSLCPPETSNLIGNIYTKILEYIGDTKCHKTFTMQIKVVVCTGGTWSWKIRESSMDKYFVSWALKKKSDLEVKRLKQRGK